MTLVLKTNMIKKANGEYFYTYIPSEIAQKLGLRKGQEHLIWGLYGSKAEITILPLDIAREIFIKSQSPAVVSDVILKKSPRIFIKNGRATDEDLI